jgi:cobalt-zinc-cadmium efflux system membrane fusion protein
VRGPWWFLLIVGCSGEAVESAAPRVAATAALADGQIQLAEPSRPYVSTIPVDDAVARLPLELPGRIELVESSRSEVHAPAGGRIVDVIARPGATVRAGAPLVIVESPEAAEARAHLARAEALDVAARAEAERQARLAEQGVGLASERLAADAAAAEAVASLAAARVRVHALGPGAGGRVALSAPIAGTVAALHGAIGAWLDAGEVVAVVADPSRVRVEAQAFESDVHWLRPGQHAEVVVAGGEGVSATVASVGATLDAERRRAPVWLALDGEPGDLRPGMFARVRVDVEVPGATLLPVEAVLLQPDRSAAVWVEGREAGVFARRKVEVGRSVAGQVPILAGLTAGDKVVVTGALLLDGALDQLL